MGKTAKQLVQTTLRELAQECLRLQIERRMVRKEAKDLMTRDYELGLSIAGLKNKIRYEWKNNHQVLGIPSVPQLEDTSGEEWKA